MKYITKHISKIFLPSVIIFAIILFSNATSNLQSGKAAEDKIQLEKAVRRAVVSCYSIEGAYPTTLEYLEDNYKISYNENKYLIIYEFYASNLMPDITVLERKPAK